MVAIAIDGPAGSGKSSVADMVAKKLGYLHIDTGALYRAVAYYILGKGINFEDEKAVENSLSNVKVEILEHNGIQKTVLNGIVLGDELRTTEVSKVASGIAEYGSVRNLLLETQRKCAKNNDVVMDGRDIGTVILPNADVKIFLTASAGERARRRFVQNSKQKKQDSYKSILKMINKRDKRDMSRELSPLKVAEDAVLIDNTDYGLDETVEKIIEVTKERLKQSMNVNFYRVVLSIIRPLIKIFYPFEVHGLENLGEAKNNYIICCNHLSNVDPAFLMLTHSKPIRFMAKSELFRNKLLAWFCGNMGAFAVKRGKGDKSALENSQKIVKSGEVLGIFIEGTRSKTGEFLRAKSGAALIAAGTSSDILPVCVTGSGKNNRVKIFHKTVVRYGEIIKFEELGYEKDSRISLKNATNAVMNSIMSLRDKKEGTVCDV